MCQGRCRKRGLEGELRGYSASGNVLISTVRQSLQAARVTQEASKLAGTPHAENSHTLQTVLAVTGRLESYILIDNFLLEKARIKLLPKLWALWLYYVSQ